jgi:predicted DNA-binding transcriptional regulator AlpA
MREGAMLRTPHAAEYLGVSAATLCKWRVFGDGPPYKKLGRAVVYDPADLRDWLAAHSKASTSTGAPMASTRANKVR